MDDPQAADQAPALSLHGLHDADAPDGTGATPGVPPLRLVMHPAGLAIEHVGDSVADRRAPDQFTVEAIEQDPRRLDMHRMAHRQYTADAGFNQPRRNGAKHRGLPDG